MDCQESFNPCDITNAQVAEWIEQGDFEEAKTAGRDLGVFLSQLAANKEAIEFLIRRGILWIGKDVAELISKRLLAGGENKAGKNTKSGRELFAKVLVPNKQSKSEFEQRWLAYVVHDNFPSFVEEAEYAKSLIKKGAVTTEEERVLSKFFSSAGWQKYGNHYTGVSVNRLAYVAAASWINQLILENNKHRKTNMSLFRPVYPQRLVTPAILEKAHRKYKAKFSTRQGVRTHKIAR